MGGWCGGRCWSWSGAALALCHGSLRTSCRCTEDFLDRRQRGSRPAGARVWRGRIRLSGRALPHRLLSGCARWAGSRRLTTILGTAGGMGIQTEWAGRRRRAQAYVRIERRRCAMGWRLRRRMGRWWRPRWTRRLPAWRLVPGLLLLSRRGGRLRCRPCRSRRSGVSGIERGFVGSRRRCLFWRRSRGRLYWFRRGRG